MEFFEVAKDLRFREIFERFPATTTRFSYDLLWTPCQKHQLKLVSDMYSLTQQTKIICI